MLRPKKCFVFVHVFVFLFVLVFVFVPVFVFSSMFERVKRRRSLKSAS